VRGWGQGGCGGRVGRMPGENGLVAGRSLGLHDVPGGAAQGGPAYSELQDVEASFGRRCEFEIRSLIRTRAGAAV